MRNDSNSNNVYNTKDKKQDKLDKLDKQRNIDNVDIMNNNANEKGNNMLLKNYISIDQLKSMSCSLDSNVDKLCFKSPSESSSSLNNCNKNALSKLKPSHSNLQNLMKKVFNTNDKNDNVKESSNTLNTNISNSNAIINNSLHLDYNSNVNSNNNNVTNTNTNTNKLVIPNIPNTTKHNNISSLSNKTLTKGSNFSNHPNYLSNKNSVNNLEDLINSSSGNKKQAYNENIISRSNNPFSTENFNKQEDYDIVNLSENNKENINHNIYPATSNSNHQINSSIFNTNSSFYISNNPKYISSNNYIPNNKPSIVKNSKNRIVNELINESNDDFLENKNNYNSTSKKDAAANSINNYISESVETEGMKALNSLKDIVLKQNRLNNIDNNKLYTNNTNLINNKNNYIQTIGDIVNNNNDVDNDLYDSEYIETDEVENENPTIKTKRAANNNKKEANKVTHEESKDPNPNINLSKNIFNNSNFNNEINNPTSSSVLDNRLKQLSDYNAIMEQKIKSLKSKLSKIPTINCSFDKLIFLKSKSFENILTYLNNSEQTTLYSINKKMKNRIQEIFNFKAHNILSLFISKYKKHLQVSNSSIVVNRYYRNSQNKLSNKQSLNSTLVIIAKIINPELENKNVVINYFSKYSSDTEVLNNTFIFDVKQPKPLSFWIFKEYTDFHCDEYNKAYFQHIMQFFVNDKIELSIPIITEKGLLQLTNIKQTFLNVKNSVIPTFKWKTIITKTLPDYNDLDYHYSNNSTNHYYNPYDQSQGREVLDFDITRLCEAELIKNVWANLKNKDPHNKTINTITKIFEPQFIVKDVFCDDVGYIIYKVILIAAKEGKLTSIINRTKNKDNYNTDDSKANFSASILDDLGITITVNSPDKSITNEVKKNFLVYDRKNTVQCRIGDIVIFYFTKN